MTREPKTPRRPADAIVSQNIRRARLASGKSQGQVSDHLGITFQQIQKYENGTNRVSVGALVEIARVLEVPVEELLVGVGPTGDKRPNALLRLGGTRDGIALAEAFNKITRQSTRKAILDLVESVAG